MPPRRAESDAKGAAAYGREAIGHWVNAARYGARAISATRKAKSSTGSLKGSTGLLKGKVGTRLMERLLPESVADAVTPGEGGGGEPTQEQAAPGDHLFDDAAPMPIQESIDVAVPVAAVFDLCTRFEELDRKRCSTRCSGPS